MLINQMKDNKEKQVFNYLKTYFNKVEDLNHNKYLDSYKDIMQRFKIPEQEAYDLKDKFFEEYPDLKVFIERYKELYDYGKRSFRAFQVKNPEPRSEKVKEDYLKNLLNWINEVEYKTAEYYKRTYLFIFMNQELFNESIFLTINLED